MLAPIPGSAPPSPQSQRGDGQVPCLHFQLVMQHKELDELQVAHDLYAITAPVWYHCRSQSKATISSALQPHWASMSVSVPAVCNNESISRCSSTSTRVFILHTLSERLCYFPG